jgi:hypothetical protein
MTALAALLHKDEQAATSGDNDGASLGHTVATEDSVQRAKRSEKTTRRGGKKSGSKMDLGASLGDLSAVLEGLGDSASSFGSEPDTMTTCTADSRDVATEDSVQRAKRSEKTTRRGGKKSGSKMDLGASLGDLSAVLEGLGDSASSFGSEPDTMTTCTADSRDVAQKRTSKKRGGRKKSKQSMALEEEEEEVVHRKRTISMDDE